MSAEHAVDQVVLESFFRDHIDKGVMIEVGAADPSTLSIGAGFRRAGWRVIGVEPNPEFCRRHRALGHTIHEFACSNEDADDVDFFVVDSTGTNYGGMPLSYESFSSLGISGDFYSLYKSAAANRPITPIKVRVRKLDTIISIFESDVVKVDVLAIDVEGWELNVLEGFSIAKFEPKVVILENLFNDSVLRNYMADHGYQLWQNLAPNDVFVRAYGS